MPLHKAWVYAGLVKMAPVPDARVHRDRGRPLACLVLVQESSATVRRWARLLLVAALVAQVVVVVAPVVAPDLALVAPLALARQPVVVVAAVAAVVRPVAPSVAVVPGNARTASPRNCVAKSSMKWRRQRSPVCASVPVKGKRFVWPEAHH
jgi:hypothetical protein